ncbi:MAG TPA: ankyrin repeat domain-containing protein [Pyrinomonadaceae bacterium]|jgi:hypothetical protein
MKRRTIITLGLSVCLLLTLAACKRSHRPSTALTVAAERGDAALVKQLIAEGVDVNQKDQAGYTALMWAARNGNTDIAKALIDARADMNARDCATNGWTPLMHAIHKNQNGVANLFIERGADVNAKAGDCREQNDNSGATALAYAAGNDNPEIVKALLAKGANPYGMHGSASVLSNAVGGLMDVDRLTNGKCPTETVKALLERAPDLNLQGDVWDRKAVFLARQKGCTELLAMLEQRQSMLGVNQGGSRLGSHLVKVSPACWTNEGSSSMGSKHSFFCGDTTVVIDAEKLTVNGQNYGTLKQGDTVEVEGGKVRVNSTEIAANGMVASN